MHRIASLLASLFVFEIPLVTTSAIRSPGVSGTACTQEVYIGDLNGGVAISHDAGETWGPLDAVVSGPYAVTDSIYAVGDTVYVGTSLGLATSRDDGQSWSVQLLFPGDMDHQDISSVFAIDSRVWVVVYWSYSIFNSDDYGQTWPIQSHLPTREFGNPGIGTVLVDGNKTYVGTYTGLGISDNNGETWQRIDQNDGLADNDAMAIAVDGDNIYVGSFFPGRGTISISHDGAKTWRIVDTIPDAWVAWVHAIFTIDGKVYVGTDGSGLSISEDGGETWVVRTTADGLASDTVESVTAIGDNIYAGTDGGLSVSRDGGKTWATKYTGHVLDPLSNIISAVFVQCV